MAVVERVTAAVFGRGVAARVRALKHAAEHTGLLRRASADPSPKA